MSDKAPITCSLDVLFPLGLLIVIAKLVEGVLRDERSACARHLGIGPPEFDASPQYTVTGVILGPVLGIVHPSPEIQLFLGLGILPDAGVRPASGAPCRPRPEPKTLFLVGLDEMGDIRPRESVQGFCGDDSRALVTSPLVVPASGPRPDQAAGRRASAYPGVHVQASRRGIDHFELQGRGRHAVRISAPTSGPLEPGRRAADRALTVRQIALANGRQVPAHPPTDALGAGRRRHVLDFFKPARAVQPRLSGLEPLDPGAGPRAPRPRKDHQAGAQRLAAVRSAQQEPDPDTANRLAADAKAVANW